jgi:hypothetical protein
MARLALQVSIRVSVLLIAADLNRERCSVANQEGRTFKCLKRMVGTRRLELLTSTVSIQPG